ncbi:MAG: CoA-binding protein [Cytophagaceae bacterium]|jgi:hypothetical protein|nr:CoA-binding protein [Cytophagaceae bacterium]
MDQKSFSKKVVVVGASDNPQRYSYLAAHMLMEYGYDMIPLGQKKGIVAGVPIHNDRPTLENVDTITLYIGPQHQPEIATYVASLHPRRVIFNPGTENPDFQEYLSNKGIEVLEACTLVLLRSGQF